MYSFLHELQTIYRPCYATLQSNSMMCGNRPYAYDVTNCSEAKGRFMYMRSIQVTYEWRPFFSHLSEVTLHFVISHAQCLFYARKCIDIPTTIYKNPKLSYSWGTFHTSIYIYSMPCWKSESMPILSPLTTGLGWGNFFSLTSFWLWKCDLFYFIFIFFITHVGSAFPMISSLTPCEIWRTSVLTFLYIPLTRYTELLTITFKPLPLEGL